MIIRAPATATPPRPDPVADPAAALYVKSYLLMRIAIGLLGVSLPLLLVLGDGLLFGAVVPRPSLSAYYHSGMHDVFAGTLCAVGVFLTTYMMFHYNWDNVLSTLAGVAVLGVALLPTEGGDPLTPAQALFGEHRVGLIHLTCAVVFIVALAAISVLFGMREGSRTDRGIADRRRGRRLHLGCAMVIVVAVAYAAANSIVLRVDANALFWAETVAVVAFGVSWLAKGIDAPALRRHRSGPAAVAVSDPASVPQSVS